MTNPSHSPEEADQLSRSKKKMKHASNEGELDGDDIEDEEMEDSFSDGPNRNYENRSQNTLEGGLSRPQGGLSYRDTLQRNNPKLSRHEEGTPDLKTTAQPDRSRPEHRERQESNTAVHNKEINQNSNSNSELELENSIVNGGNQGSRFCALSELDLNANIGEENIGEYCQNQTVGVIFERDNQNKENRPVENQGEDME
ncbi:hypothetical protein Cgig2_012039 [Carnegiea gigantea]|uniref:Uncharacterized protein n=1 Tax=Carnegiea gigantea TaxID=171969 RepID=A0A9Q1KQP1_9CARY|nr:hypothetical protein Cgig2_012039 [Carnegiea gigantea]